MKNKVLASILLATLVFYNFLSPITYALENTFNSSSEVLQLDSSSSKEVVVKVSNTNFSEKDYDLTLTLFNDDSSTKIEEWIFSGEDKKISLEVGDVYNLKVFSKASSDSLETLVLTVDEEGVISTRQLDGTWKNEDETGVLKLSFDSFVDKEVNVSEDVAEESSHKITGTFPEITVYKSGDKSIKDIAAAFKLIQEDNSSEIAEWSSTEEPPVVELEVGKVYLLRTVNIDSNYSIPNDISIRLMEAGEFERKSNDSWLQIDTLDIEVSVKRRTSLRAGQNTPLGTPTSVAADEIAPINKLRIVDDIPGASVTYLGGSSVREHFAVNNGSLQPSGGSPLYGGGSVNYSYNDTNHIGRYIDHNIYKTENNAYTVQFNGSRTGAWDYTTNVNSGWNSQDLSLSTTTMTASFRYTNAAYYEGRLVDAIATIKVTPQKNRTGTNGDYNINATYQNLPYYPSIQVGATLYSGWAWQNVNEFQVDIQFYEKGSSTPIQFSSGTYSDMKATYYTVDSLNPAGQYNNGQDSWHGPEYVLPQTGTVSQVYKYNRSNITTRYTGDPSNVNQYAYNGGTGSWGDSQDIQTSPDWSMNSVLFTTANTSHITLTLGNLSRPSRDGGNGGQNGKRTNYMWATISTDSFTNTYVTYKKIHVRKDWVGQDNPTDDISIEILATWTQNGKSEKELIQTQVLNPDNGWEADFNEVPDEESMLKVIRKKNPGTTITNFKYEVNEKNIPDGYKVKYSGASDAQDGFVVTNTQANSGLVITKKWLEDGQAISNQNTSSFGKIKVTLKRKVGNTVDNSFSQVVELEYNSNADTSWKKTVNNLPIKDDNDNDYTYYIEEDVSTIPDNFFINGYPKQNIKLKYNTNENQLEVANERKASTLTIRKRWYKQDGETEIANADLPKNLKVKLYQTTNGATSGGTLYKEITLTRQGSEGNYTWKTDEVVPVRDKAGTIYYTYYIEEENLAGYLEISEANETFVTFSSSMSQPTVELTVKNKVNPIYPTTGGWGILPYLTFGVFTLFTALLIYKMQIKKGI